jgi:hypothetical protein
MKKTSMLLILLLMALAPALAAGEEKQDTKKTGFTGVVSDTASLFKVIKVEGSNGSYKISGEARPINGKFYYTVEDGHNELVSQTAVSIASVFPKWKGFSISLSIPENKLPANGSLVLNLYEISKDGSIVHTYPVLLETLK